jgi:hypothetical protein
MYAQDFDEQIVPWIIGEFNPDNPGPRPADGQTLWPGLLLPYTKNQGIFWCPSFSEGRLRTQITRPDCGGPGAAGLFEPPTYPFTYESHFGITGAGTYGGCTEENPRIAYGGSGYTGSLRAFVFRTLAEIQRPAETCIISEGMTVRLANGWAITPFGSCGTGAHFDGQNLIFLDSHAQFIHDNPETRYIFQDGSGCWNSRYFTYDR